MQTKHYVSWSTSELRASVGAPWTGFKPSSKIFLLTVPRRCFFCGSFMLVLSYFCYTFVRVCLLMPCGHLLGKGWPLSSRLWCLIVKLSLSHWYPGSGVVLDCIDLRSLPFFLTLIILMPICFLALYFAIRILKVWKLNTRKKNVCSISTWTTSDAFAYNSGLDLKFFFFGK